MEFNAQVLLCRNCISLLQQIEKRVGNCINGSFVIKKTLVIIGVGFIIIDLKVLMKAAI